MSALALHLRAQRADAVFLAVLIALAVYLIATTPEPPVIVAEVCTTKGC